MSGALSEGDFNALVKRKRYAQTNTEFDYSEVAIRPARSRLRLTSVVSPPNDSRFSQSRDNFSRISRISQVCRDAE